MRAETWSSQGARQICTLTKVELDAARAEDDPVHVVASDRYMANDERSG